MEQCARNILRLRRNDPKVYELTKKKLVIFEKDDNHPSLRKHKLGGGLDGYWSISVNMKVRIVYFIENEEAWLVNIGTHDEVYRQD